MSGVLSDFFASISLFLKQPLESFCEVETHHPDGKGDGRLVTSRGDYVTVLRLHGLRTMCSRTDVERIAEQQRIELQGLLEGRGHVIEGWYVSDPDQALTAINTLSLNACEAVARKMDADFLDIINERRRRWPEAMRWEDACYILWTRPAVLTREERKQMNIERREQAKNWPKAGHTQRPTLRSDLLAGRHDGFVSRVEECLTSLGIACSVVPASAALRMAREALYRETAGSAWKPTLVGDRVMARAPDSEQEAKQPAHMLWPAIRDQMFVADAQTVGGQLATIGDYTYAPVDMMVGPEDPRPFSELSATLGRKRVPWRSSMILEGGGTSSFSMKEQFATLLGMFPANKDIMRAFAHLKQERVRNNHASVRMRMTTTTWAPVEDDKLVRRRAADLAMSLEGWGNCRSTRISGDPLEATMGSVPVLSLGSTAPPSLALLGDSFAMMPWMRCASPFDSGSILFRRPDGGIWPFDPTGGGAREHVADAIVSPPGGGKTVLGNTILLGLLLSSAAMGNFGVKLPLLAKLDIGPASRGFIEMVRNALGPARAHEAAFIEMQLTAGHEVNIFDLQVGLEYPLPLEREFIKNFVSLLVTPLDGCPYDGMDHLIEDVIDEAYRLCTEVSGCNPKPYQAGVCLEIDAAIADLGLVLPHHDASPGDPDSADPTHWRDIVTALIALGEHRLAGFAQRYAVPVLQDLVMAARSPQIEDRYTKVVAPTKESLIDVFDRYILNAIKNYETLAAPTRLDLGDARVIVLDLAAVAGKGSVSADRQTALMYMLGRHLIARNFFLHPEYADLPIVPNHVREYHRARFTEMKETTKRLDYEEWHRASNAPAVDAQAITDVREGRKHNVQMSFVSQRAGDFSQDLVGQCTGYWVLKTRDEKESLEVIQNFRLNETSAQIVRHKLPGPGRGGAPFFLIIDAGGKKYEQLLINVLGPIELWAFSSTPADTALRNRLFRRMPSSRALRCLAIVFPGGSAEKEIIRRKTAQMQAFGQQDEEAELAVIDALVEEVATGRGIAAGMFERLREMEDADHQAA